MHGSDTTTKRLICIVLDGVGIGELPDARLYGDEGSHTLRSTALAGGGLRLPHLEALGLGNIDPIPGIPPRQSPRASHGKMAERSRGKDSTTGHWELAGLPVEKDFPTYPEGFPPEVIASFLRATGAKGFLGNTTASGTAIIQDLGAEHVRTGYPIVYTSADSVFQIAAHEGVTPVGELYEICRRTREEVCVGRHAVGRVIARPFVGEPGSFRRTSNRKDFSLEPSGPTVLDLLSRHSIPVCGVGKIDDLFALRGLSRSNHTRSNMEGVSAILDLARELDHGLIIANLGDFDTLYGHRNDPAGLARALEAFDARFPEIEETLRAGEMFIVTADHGNDPVTPSTDHSREYVPLLVLVKGAEGGRDLGVRSSFADVGKTIAEYFGVDNQLSGTSFLSQVLAP